MNPADVFRKNAERCREVAKNPGDSEDDSERWLQLAEAWQLLADEADKRPEAF